MKFSGGLLLCSSLLCATAAVAISAAQPSSDSSASEAKALKALHANVAAFIGKTESGMAGQSP